LALAVSEIPFPEKRECVVKCTVLQFRGAACTD
jgi:hypothetical protein